MLFVPNVLRPTVLSSTGCLRTGRSSCCVPDDVLDPEDIRRVVRKCADGCRRRGREQPCTLARLRASRRDRRTTGPLAGGSWSRPSVWWFVRRRMSPNTGKVRRKCLQAQKRKKIFSVFFQCKNVALHRVLHKLQIC